MALRRRGSPSICQRRLARAILARGRRGPRRGKGQLWVLVEQALGQIIANAAKFSPPASTIQIAAHTENQQLIISVIDKGVGLTTDEKARLAERFFRGQRHDGKISGSGLGMWIANTFIMSNGGILEARPFRKSYPGILIVQSG
jgi:K+-sensing histidine kinase KdpD